MDVNDDGTVTYRSEDARWHIWRRGSEGSRVTMTADVARERWPSYAKTIDAALEEIRSQDLMCREHHGQRISN